MVEKSLNYSSGARESKAASKAVADLSPTDVVYVYKHGGIVFGCQ